MSTDLICVIRAYLWLICKRPIGIDNLRRVIIESSAPPRVDLAGGTIDIWPLYLFHPGATTVNFALSLRARCTIETQDDGRIVLESRDRKVAFETDLSAIEDLLL